MRLSLLMASFLTLSSTAQAGFVTLDLSSLVDSPLSGYTDGANYPVAGNLTIGGVPFVLAGNNSSASVMGGGAVVGTPTSYALTGLNIGDVVAMYAIINSAFGRCGETIGSLGANSASFNIVEGANARDHYFGDMTFCQLAPDAVATANYGGTVRLDVFRFDLSAATLNGTLPVTSFLFETLGAAGGGEPFVAAVTFETTVVPEPGSGWLLLVPVLGWLVLRTRAN